MIRPRAHCASTLEVESFDRGNTESADERFFGVNVRLCVSLPCVIYSGMIVRRASLDPSQTVLVNFFQRVGPDLNSV